MMNEILHANIFFFIASLATFIFCIMVSIILYHLIKIMRSIRAVIERIEAGSEIIAEDAEQVRAFITNGGLFSRVVQFVVGARGGRARKRSHKKD